MAFAIAITPQLGKLNFGIFFGKENDRTFEIALSRRVDGRISRMRRVALIFSLGST